MENLPHINEIDNALVMRLINLVPIFADLIMVIEHSNGTQKTKGNRCN